MKKLRVCILDKQLQLPVEDVNMFVYNLEAY